MSKLEIFEPPMCCSTGVCGSSADTELERVAAALENLRKAGIEVERHNLSSEPIIFMQNEEVANVLNQRGADALPLTVRNGEIVQSGRYPTNEEFSRLLGVALDTVKPATRVKVNKCGCDSKGCCS